jgi:hypothetical protein
VDTALCRVFASASQRRVRIEGARRAIQEYLIRERPRCIPGFEQVIEGKEERISTPEKHIGARPVEEFHIVKVPVPDRGEYA